jgi:hypothetical protein
MVVLLGFIVMLAAIAAVVGVASTGGTVHVDFYGMGAGNHSIGAIFAMGAVAGVVFALGVMLLRDGAARARRRRIAQREAEDRRLADERALRDRNAMLERSLQSRTDANAPLPETAPPATARQPVTTGRHAAH